MRADPPAFAHAVAATAFWAVALAAPAAAQVPGEPIPQPSSRTSDARWEVEGHGGAIFRAMGGGGSVAVPSPGAPILTSNPTFSSRQISSWFFGNGATLLNGVTAGFDLPNQITPLDPALSARRFDPARATSVGFRLRRKLTSRLSAEVSVDATPGTTRLPAAVRAQIASTRDSFTAAMTALLSTGPFSNAVVDASATTSDGATRDVVATGAVNLRFGTLGGFVPYATVGAGVLASTGTAPSATLEGHYRFSILGAVPIEETDRVTVRYVGRTTIVGVFGGGLRRAIGRQWGLVVDARALLGRNNTRVLLDAQPSVTPGAPAGFIESFTNPAVQFSNNPATGRQSTLSGPTIQGFTAFTGGLQARVLLTLGVFRRF